MTAVRLSSSTSQETGRNYNPSYNNGSSVPQLCFYGEVGAGKLCLMERMSLGFYLPAHVGGRHTVQRCSSEHPRLMSSVSDQNAGGRTKSHVELKLVHSAEPPSSTSLGFQGYSNHTFCGDAVVLCIPADRILYRSRPDVGFPNPGMEVSQDILVAIVDDFLSSKDFRFILDRSFRFLSITERHRMRWFLSARAAEVSAKEQNNLLGYAFPLFIAVTKSDEVLSAKELRDNTLLSSIESEIMWTLRKRSKELTFTEVSPSSSEVVPTLKDFKASDGETYRYTGVRCPGCSLTSAKDDIGVKFLLRQIVLDIMPSRRGESNFRFNEERKGGVRLPNQSETLMERSPSSCSSSAGGGLEASSATKNSTTTGEQQLKGTTVLAATVTALLVGLTVVFRHRK